MAKQIKIKDKDGNSYILEFTRKSIETMERNGFNITELNVKPMTMLPEFFAGAFLAHHKFVKRPIIDEIFNGITNREQLIETLAEMYNEPLISLMDEPTEEEGKFTWETL